VSMFQSSSMNIPLVSSTKIATDCVKGWPRSIYTAYFHNHFDIPYTADLAMSAKMISYMSGDMRVKYLDLVTRRFMEQDGRSIIVKELLGLIGFARNLKEYAMLMWSIR
jgi:hypothetical protein